MSNTFEINIPETRPEVLNCRVTETNKKFIQKICKKHNASESLVVNQIIDQFRQVEGDSNKGKPRRGN